MYEHRDRRRDRKRPRFVTLSQTIFAGVWGTLLGGYIGLVLKKRIQLTRIQSTLADEIQAYNSRNGYGRQIGRENLARSMLIPFKTKPLEQFAKANGVAVETYIDEIKSNVGYPVLPAFSFGILIVSTIYMIYGIVFFINRLFIKPEYYLIIASILLFINLSSLYILDY